MTELVERFRALVASRLGLALDPAGRSPLDKVLAGRLKATGADGEAYLRELARAGLDGELGALAQELTVGETYLFRNAEQFRALAEVALPEVTRGRAGGALRILSAGCASGEEPYSIAITAGELLPAPAWTVAIRAVDASAAVLARARRGRYRGWSLRETPQDVQRRYFRAVGNELVLDAAVRGAVSFEQRNLADADPVLWAEQSYDVVFCRNVIMYFSLEVQRAVIARIAQALVPGGYCFLGHAETMRGLSNEFALCNTHGAFYYRRLGAEPRERPAIVWPGEPGDAFALGSSAGLPAMLVVPAVVPAPVPAARASGGGDWVDAIQLAGERIAALAASQPEASSAAPVAPGPGWSAVDLAAVVDLIRRERFAEALAILDGVPPGPADEPEVLTLRAVLGVHTGQLDAAEAACRRWLARDPRAAGAHHVLALCCQATGDRGGAEEHDRTAAYLDPTFAMPRLHRGLAARRAGDRTVARRELGHALVLLQRESASRVALFGGGFDRDALIALCRAELAACEAAR